MVRKERKDAYRESEWAIDYHNTVIPVHSTKILVYIDKRGIDLYKESIGFIYDTRIANSTRFRAIVFSELRLFSSIPKNNLNKRKSILLKKK